jgi:hypothetical protein
MHGVTTRKYLLAMSVVMLVTGVGFYFWNHSQSEDDIRTAETAVAGKSAAEVDELYTAQTGMTFEEAKAHQRGLVNLQLAGNLALAGIFFGMWFLAKTNAYAAALIASFMFVAVLVITTLYEPRTLVQWITVKALLAFGLVQAVRAGRAERR